MPTETTPVSISAPRPAAAPAAAPLEPEHPAGDTRILLFDAHDGDADATTARLARDGLDATVTHVRRPEEFRAACARGACEAILSDFQFPDWDGWSALEVARNFCPGVPFLFVSRMLGEEIIADSLRHGAADYVSKDRMGRLVPAIRRALADRDARTGLLEARTALHAHELSFRLIADNTRDLICVHAPDRRFLFVSASVRALLGYEPDELVGRPPREFGHPLDLEKLVAEVADVIGRGKRGDPIVLRARHKAGHYVWLETLIEPVRDADGGVVRLLSVSRDFTERREAELAMKRSERLFEGIAEANRLLLLAASVSESLPRVLGVLGEAAGADRVSVFEFHPHSKTGHPASTLRAEWARLDVPSLFNDARLVEFPVAELGDKSMVHRINQGQEVEASIDELSGNERDLLLSHGVISMLTFPVRVSERIWGHITFDQCIKPRRWSPQERSVLGTVASNIGQAIRRDQTQAALAASEARYESLLAGLSEGVFHVDLEARWRFLNPTWIDLTGHPVSESIGRRFSEFIAPEDAPGALEAFGRLLSGRGDRVESELRFRHRRGDLVWLHITAQAQVDPSGRVAGVSGTLIDVTQRRLAQEALSASERKFSAVFASASDALFLVDSRSNVILELNPRATEMFEAGSPSSLIGTQADALHRHPLTPLELEDGRARLARGEVWSLVLEYTTLQGRAFWGQLAVVRMQPEALRTTLVRVTDITESKQTEERLRASLGEKEVLLKEVYHRVKNNLQIISALLRMQTRRVKEPHALEALENSINRVMAMSMVHEKLYQAQNLVSIDLLSFAQSLVGFLNQLTIGAKVPIAIDVSGTSLALSIDQAIPLGLVLNELVTNSLKYAFPEDSEPGRVLINIELEGPHAARVVVADNGVGLPPSLDPDNAGGLGFRIVRMLVEQLQGTLAIESKGGLTVSVRVPLPANRPREAPAL